MIVYDNNKEYRNLQEQVAKNQDDIETIKQALGNALPDPIEGPQGEPGERGPAGPEGPRGNIIKTVGLPLPSPSGFKEGDLALVIVSPEVGNLYKITAGRWVLQCNIRGAQGVPGPRTQVVVNPVDPATDVMYKLKIDGVTYDFDTGYVRCIGAPASTTLTNAERQAILGGCFVNGEFLGYTNPVFFPATQSGSYYYGVIMGPYNGTSYTIIGQYQINPDNSIVERGVYGNIELRGIEVINGKQVPHYPNSGVQYGLVQKPNGDLGWSTGVHTDNLMLTITGTNTDIIEMYVEDGQNGGVAMDFSGDSPYLSIGAGVNIHQYLIVQGETQIDNNLTVNNDLTVDNDITCAGTLKCTDIYMSGNSRFDEGELNTNTISGVTYTYAKWSLSGTHLMFVLAGTIANGTSLTNQTLATVSLPAYIANKIVPVWANDFIELKNVTLTDNSWGTQTMSLTIAKSGASTVYFYQPGTITATSDKHFRIAFDLLIDMA